MTGRLRHTLDIIIVLLQKDLKVRYKSTLLGYAWSVAHPLAFACVFFLAFKVIIRIPVPDYALFLITGLFPWQWFSNSLQASPITFLANASIIKKVSFPRNLLVLVLVFQDMIHFVISIPVIVLFLLLYGLTPSWSWLYGIPLLLVIQFFVTYGLALILSSANLFFRDLERLTFIAVTLLFYFTPVLYPETMIPADYRFLLAFNPLAFLMVNWQKLLMHGDLSFTYCAYSVGYALLSYVVGSVVYKRFSWRFAEVL